jgi:hypothetical protein
MARDRFGWIDRLSGGVPDDRPHECMYGDTYGATGNCTIGVPPHQGWRQAGMVFCSEEHAILDQEEQAF